jgi:hypothetical protein
LAYKAIDPEPKTFFNSFDMEEKLFREMFFQEYSKTSSLLGETNLNRGKEDFLALAGQIDGFTLQVLPRASFSFRTKLQALDKELKLPLTSLSRGYDTKSQVYEILKKKMALIARDYFVILSKKPIFRVNPNAKTVKS